jgi:hypothetical protein
VDFGGQCRAIVLQSRRTHRAPGSLPAKRLPAVQPETKANAVALAAPHEFAVAAGFTEQRQTGLESSATVLPVPCKDSRIKPLWESPLKIIHQQ